MCKRKIIQVFAIIRIYNKKYRYTWFNYDLKFI